MNILNDDELPLWLHSTLSLTIGFFCGFYFWLKGFSAIFTGRLDPIWNFDGANYLLCSVTVEGGVARLHGVALICLGLSFFSIGAANLRRYKMYDGWVRLIPAFLFLGVWMIILFTKAC